MITNYQRGARRERMFVNKLKEEGWDIVQRAAGSHSPIDVFAINRDTHDIFFIQCKPRSMSSNSKSKLEGQNMWLNNQFNCHFKCVSLFEELNIGGNKKNGN